MRWLGAVEAAASIADLHDVRLRSAAASGAHQDMQRVGSSLPASNNGADAHSVRCCPYSAPSALEAVAQDIERSSISPAEFRRINDLCGFSSIAALASVCANGGRHANSSAVASGSGAGAGRVGVRVTSTHVHAHVFAAAGCALGVAEVAEQLEVDLSGLGAAAADTAADGRPVSPFAAQVLFDRSGSHSSVSSSDSGSKAQLAGFLRVRLPAAAAVGAPAAVPYVLQNGCVSDSQRRLQACTLQSATATLSSSSNSSSSNSSSSSSSSSSWKLNSSSGGDDSSSGGAVELLLSLPSTTTATTSSSSTATSSSATSATSVTSLTPLTLTLTLKRRYVFTCFNDGHALCVHLPLAYTSTTAPAASSSSSASASVSASVSACVHLHLLDPSLGGLSSVVCPSHNIQLHRSSSSNIDSGSGSGGGAVQHAVVYLPRAAAAAAYHDPCAAGAPLPALYLLVEPRNAATDWAQLFLPPAAETAATTADKQAGVLLPVGLPALLDAAICSACSSGSSSGSISISISGSAAPAPVAPTVVATAAAAPVAPPASLSLSSLPQHIAVVMDGNGRWATARGLRRSDGHRAGVETIHMMIRACRRLRVRYLTLYAFSAQNWSRPAEEVGVLMSLLAKFVATDLAELVSNGVRLLVNGDMDKLPPTVVSGLRHMIDASAHNKELTLCLALSYGGREEIASAAAAACRAAVEGSLDPSRLDCDAFRAFLPHPHVPDPDLLIRTSGELRVSNFLLWQIAYTELYVTPVLWPDFDEGQLTQALLAYASRERRFGKTSAQLQSGSESDSNSSSSSSSSNSSSDVLVAELERQLRATAPTLGGGGKHARLPQAGAHSSSGSTSTSSSPSMIGMALRAGLAPLAPYFAHCSPAVLFIMLPLLALLALLVTAFPPALGLGHGITSPRGGAGVGLGLGAAFSSSSSLNGLSSASAAASCPSCSCAASSSSSSSSSSSPPFADDGGGGRVVSFTAGFPGDSHLLSHGPVHYQHPLHHQLHHQLPPYLSPEAEVTPAVPPHAPWQWTVAVPPAAGSSSGSGSKDAAQLHHQQHQQQVAEAMQAQAQLQAQLQAQMQAAAAAAGAGAGMGAAAATPAAGPRHSASG